MIYFAITNNIIWGAKIIIIFIIIRLNIFLAKINITILTINNWFIITIYKYFNCFFMSFYCICLVIVIFFIILFSRIYIIFHKNIFFRICRNLINFIFYIIIIIIYIIIINSKFNIFSCCYNFWVISDYCSSSCSDSFIITIWSMFFNYLGLFYIISSILSYIINFTFGIFSLFVIICGYLKDFWIFWNHLSSEGWHI